MKVLLIKDVFKLGLAGEVKKVADGYGRNYLIPQGLAVLATPGALKQAERIRQAATARRDILNKEMGHVAEKLQDVMLNFAVRAGETGKLYGSITTRMIVDGLQEVAEVELSPRQVDTQPIRQLGLHDVSIRLTIDLVPQIKVLVYREGESPATALEEALAAEAGEELVEEVAEEVEAGLEGEAGLEAADALAEAGVEAAAEGSEAEEEGEEAAAVADELASPEAEAEPAETTEAVEEAAEETPEEEAEAA